MNTSQLLYMAAGILLAVVLGDRLFPDLSGSLGNTVFAGIKGGVGVALGLIAYEIVRRLRTKKK